ncbi:hypothetical protein [Algoriphagus boritolerans]
MGDDQKEYKALMTAKAKLKESQNLLDIANLNSAFVRYHFGSGNLDSAVYYAQKCLAFF